LSKLDQRIPEIPDQDAEATVPRSKPPRRLLSYGLVILTLASEVLARTPRVHGAVRVPDASVMGDRDGVDEAEAEARSG